uniref:Uncharacterized protein n=2 Tax=Magallana TaxID=2171616 RepID=K1R122_MAGGI
MSAGTRRQGSFHRSGTRSSSSMRSVKFQTEDSGSDRSSSQASSVGGALPYRPTSGRPPSSRSASR